MLSPKISFTCIGHREVNHLKELLPSLKKIAHEVIFVDCESADGSFEYAESMGCRVFQRKNTMNLNINKSFAMEQATGDWIFYIDPDERLPEALLREIQSKLLSTSAIAFDIPRKNHFFGSWLKHGGQYPDYQRRLFKKGSGFFSNQHVHEKINIDGRVDKLTEPMLHFPYLTISQYLRKFDFYTSFEADYLYNQKGIRPSMMNHLMHLSLKPESRFIRRYFFKGGFLDGIPGLFAALFDALGIITRYFKLWEIDRKKFPKN